MKIRTFKYAIKEGFSNAYKNKLMSLASVSIITATLLVFGIFYAAIVNLRLNTGSLKEKPYIQVFCKPELDSFQTSEIETALKENEDISEVQNVSKKDAYNRLKELLGEDSGVLEGYDETFLPVSFIIKLKIPENYAIVIENIKKIDGVYKVAFQQKTLDTITKVSQWLQVVCSFLLIVLMTISVFIISNTIRLTVFARRKEINIMKFIGATDGFIRWPFVVEGLVIGLAGSVLAFFLMAYGYNLVAVRIASEMAMTGYDILKIASLSDFGLSIAAFFLITGMLVGALGSLMSLRKHLRV